MANQVDINALDAWVKSQLDSSAYLVATRGKRWARGKPRTGTTKPCIRWSSYTKEVRRHDRGCNSADILWIRWSLTVADVQESNAETEMASDQAAVFQALLDVLDGAAYQDVFNGTGQRIAVIQMSEMLDVYEGDWSEGDDAFYERGPHLEVIVKYPQVA